MAKKWYVLHTYASQEAKVRESLQYRIIEDSLEDSFGQILLPTRETMTIKNGKRSSQVKKFFPSYLIIEMDMNDLTNHFVLEQPGVTNFIGVGNKPQAIRPNEVERLLGQVDPEKQASTSEAPFQVGESVKIKEGPFKEFDGTVDEVSVEKGNLKVMVSVFGRLTPVELDFLQVEPI